MNLIGIFRFFDCIFFLCRKYINALDSVDSVFLWPMRLPGRNCLIGQCQTPSLRRRKRNHHRSRNAASCCAAYRFGPDCKSKHWFRGLFRRWTAISIENLFILDFSAGLHRFCQEFVPHLPNLFLMFFGSKYPSRLKQDQASAEWAIPTVKVCLALVKEAGY